MEVHIPKLLFRIEDFSTFRGLEYSKLNKGLGLEAMAIPDVHEDPATMAANAIVQLLKRNNLKPSDIGRLYLGTESALDGAKPTATYILDMLSQYFQPEFGPDCFRHCDVVDMTFACIGAVDAMHNTLDWVARGGEAEDRIGIAVFSDNAKYDLGSGGEYTQGAGAGAVIIKHNPRLLAIPDCWGVSTSPVHDFFKPLRVTSSSDVIQSVATLAREVGIELPPDFVTTLVNHSPNSSVKGNPLFEPVVKIHKATPVFDGQFSNRCYSEAVVDAFMKFQSQAKAKGLFGALSGPLSEAWARIVVHLPYAFQGQRMLPAVYVAERVGTEAFKTIEEAVGLPPVRSSFGSDKEYLAAVDEYRRLVSKTPEYQSFVRERHASSQLASRVVGNLYTGSIFLALMSTFEADFKTNTTLEGEPIGFCAYGSGCKAKVFQGIVQPQWREVVAKFKLFERLEARRPITSAEYLSLHQETRAESLIPAASEFSVRSTDGPLQGQRSYDWRSSSN